MEDVELVLSIKTKTRCRKGSPETEGRAHRAEELTQTKVSSYVATPGEPGKS